MMLYLTVFFVPIVIEAHNQVFVGHSPTSPQICLAILPLRVLLPKGSI